MALLATGTKTVSGGALASVKKHLKLFNLQPAKKIIVKFDPLGPNSKQMRLFLYTINRKAVLQTNPYCKILHEINCDRSEPTVDVLLATENSVKLKCANFTVLDMIKIYNEHVSSLAPKLEPVQNTIAVKIRRRK